MGEDDRAFGVDFSIEGVSRLREDVGEKLKEFMGDYTDDTLVEYVIVLLKNGRSKDEAKSELNVFLGDDSGSFVSWLWDHLGSNSSLYMQPEKAHPDGAPEQKPTSGDKAGKTESHQIESGSDKANFIKVHGHHRHREVKSVVSDAFEKEVPLNSVTDNVNPQDETHQMVGRAKKSLSPRPTIHKKRRKTEEKQSRKQRENSQPTVCAPRRLLQFAVRDAVGTPRPSSATAEPRPSSATAEPRPSSATAEPSLKRLRSVVYTSTGDPLLEERPQRIRRTTISSAAIKAVAEAVKDVNKVRPSRNVFDRLGRTTDVVLETTNHRGYENVAEDVGGVDFIVEKDDFHSAYDPRNGSSRLQESNMSSFHETIMDSDLGYDGEGYDDLDARGREATDLSRSGTYGYGAVESVDERLHRPRKDLGQPATVHNTSLKIASAVGMNKRKPQYQEEREGLETYNDKVVQGSDTLATKSDVWLMKENNNPIVASNGNATPDIIMQQPEKTQTSTWLHNTGPPTEDADSRTIFVSNVHFAAAKDSISRHFNKFGEVLKVIILTDPATGQPKGSAYIEFMRKEAAELALSLDGTYFMSRNLKIVRKSTAQTEAAVSVTTRPPRVARASPFAIPRFGRAPFPRGIPALYRTRLPLKPGGGARSFQWKREGEETSVQPPTTRGLTYVRPESKTNASTGTA
ncbi:hypothetical protein ABFX02_14G167200 [Erythranthe guttata]